MNKQICFLSGLFGLSLLAFAGSYPDVNHPQRPVPSRNDDDYYRACYERGVIDKRGLTPYPRANKQKSSKSSDRLGKDETPCSFGSEFLIDTTHIYCAAPYNQHECAIAFDGTNYLVVWSDGREQEDYDNDIYCARVSPSGEVLDPTGIVICSDFGYDQIEPAVAFDGINYLVVWADNWSFDGWYDIYGARVSPSGVVLDPQGFPIFTQYDIQAYPAVAFDGTNYLVLWHDFYDEGARTNLYASRVTPSGGVLDPAGILISAEIGYQYAPSVAFDGTNYLVAWMDDRNGTGPGDMTDIYGARVDTSGTVLDPGGILIRGFYANQGYPSIAFDGTNYLVVWDDYPTGYYYGIIGTRVTPAGAILDPLGIVIAINEWDPQWYPSVTFNGTNYLVTWEDYTDEGMPYCNIWGGLVNPAGEVLDRFAVSQAPNNQRLPVVSNDGIKYFVVWQDGRSALDFDIVGSGVDAMGSVLNPDGILISTAGSWEECPAVAFDGTNYLAVWADYRDEDYRWTNIYGGRVSQSGAVLDATNISISTATSWQSAPAVVFGGTNYLVVWQDLRVQTNLWDVYCARVSPSGTVLDPAGIAVSTLDGSTQYEPAVAFDGTNYLVVWEDGRNDSEYRNIYGARISQAGAVLDPAGIAISTIGPYYQGKPEVAFDGTNYLIVWIDMRNGSCDIYGSRVTPSGTILDPGGIAISTSVLQETYPVIAFDGINYLVVWVDDRNGNYDIYGARVSPSGNVLDPEGISICADGYYWQILPSAVFDGTNWQVVWSDFRNGEYDIYGAHVNALGAIVDSFIVSTLSGDKYYLAQAKGGGTLIVTWSGWTPSPYNAMRIWGNIYGLVGLQEKEISQPSNVLLQINPSPFNRRTTISCGISSRNHVYIEIYDASGRSVKQFNDLTAQRVNSVVWDGTDDSGRPVPAGIYFVQLEADGSKATKKVILMK